MKLNPQQIEVVDDALIPILRAKTPLEKMEMFFQGFDLVRLLISAGVRSRHPSWTQAEVEKEVARRILHGSETTLGLFD